MSVGQKGGASGNPGLVAGFLSVADDLIPTEITTDYKDTYLVYDIVTNDGHFFELPTNTLGNLIYKTITGATEWSWGHTDVAAASDGWAGFYQDGTADRIYVFATEEATDDVKMAYITLSTGVISTVRTYQLPAQFGQFTAGFNFACPFDTGSIFFGLESAIHGVDDSSTTINFSNRIHNFETDLEGEAFSNYPSYITQDGSYVIASITSQPMQGLIAMRGLMKADNRDGLPAVSPILSVDNFDPLITSSMFNYFTYFQGGGNGIHSPGVGWRPMVMGDYVQFCVPYDVVGQRAAPPILSRIVKRADLDALIKAVAAKVGI